MGPAALRDFWALTEPRKRLKAVRAARNGGSVNTRQWRALRAALKLGTLRIEERVQVTRASYEEEESNTTWRLHIRMPAPGPSSPTTKWVDEVISAEVLWCACGSAPDAKKDPMLSPLLAGAPALVLGGFPVLTSLEHGCRWPGAPVYVLGAYATLTLGPAAHTHAGHRMGAAAVAAALVRDAAAAAAGNAPYDAAAGDLGLDLLDDDEDAAALADPFCVVVPARAPSAAAAADLPPEVARRNVATFTWEDASSASGDITDMRLIVRAPIPDASTVGTQPKCVFGVRTADVWAVGESVAYRLHLPALYKDVVPSRCVAQVVASPRDGGARLIVTLYKCESLPWRMLKA
jgi:hypothetical protein